MEPSDQSFQTDARSLAQVASGPPVYANWLALTAGGPCLGTEEYPLSTDARITGEVTQGPYHFLNMVPRYERGLVQPTILLRLDRHAEFPQPDITRTDVNRYHGGSFPQEIAALSSMALGIRVKAGGLTRYFEPDGDPKGRPTEWRPRPFGGFITCRDSASWILANAAEGDHSLAELDILASLPKLSASDAVALVRAARLYQEALWLVESEPEMSWLMLVSALETAANQWQKTNETPVDRLKSSRPQLYEYLISLGPEVPAKVAEHIADALGVTAKFVSFVLEFLPPPPSVRPPEAFQHPWNEAEIRDTVRVIYNYRSRALHDGIPFPAPMCGIPFRHPEWPARATAEVPLGLATASAGGVWLRRDTPILLHVFEYIARSVLINWWRRGASVNEPLAGNS